MRAVAVQMRAVWRGGAHRASEIVFQHRDRTADQLGVGNGGFASIAGGGGRAKVRHEAAPKELPENARTIERKAEKEDGRQADCFNPPLIDRKPNQQR